MGCTKLTYQKNHFLEIIHSKKRASKEIKRINYYPFGMRHKGYNNVINGTDHPYGFLSMEEQNEFNGTLGWIDITARNYDPALGRWMNIDPLADQMRRHSPYNYAFNNPIFFMDPDGMAPLDIFKLNSNTGEINLVEKNDDLTDTLVDADGGATISANVDKGLLSDGQNIKKNGLESSNVSGAGKLATDISMNTNEEIVSVVYQNEDKEKFIEVRPYDNNSVERNENGDVISMDSGTSQEIESTFTSSDGSFTGKPIYSVHTHPGHPDAIGTIGDPDPSNDDINIARMNKSVNNVDIPYYIIGAKKSNMWGKSSNRVKYYNTANGGMKVKTVQPPKKKKN